MAEIITPGRLPENEWFEHTCSSCHCRFKFQKKEVKVSSDQRDGNAYSINCPFCSRTCWIVKMKEYNPPSIDPY